MVHYIANDTIAQTIAVMANARGDYREEKTRAQVGANGGTDEWNRTGV